LFFYIDFVEVVDEKEEAKISVEMKQAEFAPLPRRIGVVLNVLMTGLLKVNLLLAAKEIHS